MNGFNVRWNYNRSQNNKMLLKLLDLATNHISRVNQQPKNPKPPKYKPTFSANKNGLACWDLGNAS